MKAQHAHQQGLTGTFQMFDHLSEAVVVCDDQDHIVYVNEKAVCIFGYAADQMLGALLTQFCPELSFAKVAPDGTPAVTPWRRQLAGSSFQALETTYYTYFPQGDQAKGYLITSTHDQTASTSEVEALKTELRLLRTAVAGLKGGQAMVDLNTGRYAWDDQALSLLGVTQEKLRANPESWRNNLTDEDQRRALEAEKRAAQGEGFRDMPLTVNHPTRGVVYLLASAQPMIDINGKVAQVTGLLLDVTEKEKDRKRKEDEQAKMKLVLDASDIGYIIYNQTTGSLDYNERALEVFRLAKGSKNLGDLRTWLAQVHEDDQPTVEKMLELMKQGHSARNVRLSLTSDTSTALRYVDCSWQFVHGTGPTVVSITFSEVTRLVVQEQQLKESAKVLDAALDLSQLGLWVLDARTQRIEINQRMLEIYGEPNDSFDPADHTPWFEKIHPDDLPRIEANFAEVLAGKSFYQEPLRVLVQGRPGPTYLLASIMPLKNPDGTLDKVVSVTQDVTETRSQQAAVALAAKKLAWTIEASGAGTMELDPEGNTMTFNQRQQELFGLTDEEARSPDNWQAKIHPDDRKTVEEDVELALQGKTVGNRRLRILPDGPESTRYLLSSMYPVVSEDGTVKSLLALHIDVTDIRQRELQATALTEQVNLAMKAARMGFWTYDVTTGKVHPSSSLLEIYGVSDQDLQDPAKELPELVHPEDRAIRDAKFEELLHLKDHSNSEATFRIIQHGTGDEITLNSFAKVAARDPQGRPAVLAGVTVDVTQLRRNERELQHTTTQLKSAMESGRVGVWVMDMRTQVFEPSPALLKIYGLAPEEFTGTEQLEELNHPEERQYAYEEISRAFKGEKVYNVQHRIIGQRSGRTKWISSSARPVFGPDGSTEYVLGTVVDITELKEQEQALAERNAELEKLTSELDSFVYSTSHNLRAPIASVKGLLTLLEPYVDPAEEPQQWLALVRKSLTRLDEAVVNIVDFLRSQRLEVVLEEINLAAMAREVFESHSYLHLNTPPQLILEVDEAFTFTSDPSRMDIVLQNLIANAVKYTDPGKPDSFVKVVGYHQDGNTIIEVSDNGIGISDKHHGQVFDMFFRATSVATGSGMGLYIVRETLAKLGGEVSVSSAAGVGTTFTLVLPAS